MIRKKLIAGLSASVMAIAVSATSVSAFADEVNLVQEQQELQTADVNRDGKVDDADLVRLNQYLAGLVYPL